MITLYLFSGLLAAVIGALPLGASNIAVMNTTIKQNSKQALKIIVTAALAEVILSYYALHCNAIVRHFFNENQWLQMMVVAILFIVGVLLYFKKEKERQQKKRRFVPSKYATGLLIGLLNPPVLIYWILAFGIMNSRDLMISIQSSLSILFLFFVGVYFGKFLVLFLYGRFSNIMKSRVGNSTGIVNRITGILLVIIALAQSIKLILV